MTAGASPRLATAAEEFSELLNTSYDELAKPFQVVARLRPLYDAVVVAEALRKMPEIDSSYWLDHYHMPIVATPRAFALETRREALHTAGGPRTLRITAAFN